jgi:hypothetical protein
MICPECNDGLGISKQVFDPIQPTICGFNFFDDLTPLKHEDYYRLIDEELEGYPDRIAREHVSNTELRNDHCERCGKRQELRSFLFRKIFLTVCSDCDDRLQTIMIERKRGNRELARDVRDKFVANIILGPNRDNLTEYTMWLCDIKPERSILVPYSLIYPERLPPEFFRGLIYEGYYEPFVHTPLSQKEKVGL